MCGFTARQIHKEKHVNEEKGNLTKLIHFITQIIQMVNIHYVWPRFVLFLTEFPVES